MIPPLKKYPVCCTYCLLCLVVTVPGLFFDSYFELFSGAKTREHWWQYITMAFQHGTVGNTASILGHLALNMILLVGCSQLVEPMLGSVHFLVLSLVALAAYIATQFLAGVWVNGSSGVIWAYTPFLLTFIRLGKSNPALKSMGDRALGLLIIMWGLVTIGMGFVPMIYQTNQTFLRAFLFGNLFHVSATAIGFMAYLGWKDGESV